MRAGAAWGGAEPNYGWRRQRSAHTRRKNGSARPTREVVRAAAAEAVPGASGRGAAAREWEVREMVGLDWVAEDLPLRGAF